MAELQYVINVKCINTKLAEIITGELGDLIIVNIQDSLFTPHEFDKLIDATKIIKDQALKNRERKNEEIKVIEKIDEKEYGISVIEKRKLWDIKVLRSGEIMSINLPSCALAPSEFDDFIEELEKTKEFVTNLRAME